MKHISNPFLWLLLAFALFFVGLNAVGFVGPDEPRYADVARGMLTTGDYVTPRLFGSPWFEKPPLYYWMAALSFRMGVNEIDARLPSALPAAFFIGIWFWFARELFKTRAAALSCMLLGSTLGWIGFAHAATMDMLFSVTLDASLMLLALWFWQEDERYLYGFYALLGLATLAKGPAAIILAGLIALAYFLTFREWQTLRQTVFSPAVALFAAVAVPWYLLCYERNGYVFIQEFIIKHNFGRYLTAALGHPQPVWFFVPIVAAGMFPWTPLLLLPLSDLVTGARAIFASRQRAFLFYWVVLPFLFFSFSQNKLPGYVLPILPPLALWIAAVVEKERPEQTAEPAPANRKALRPRERIPQVAEPKQETPPGAAAETAATTPVATQEEKAADATWMQRSALWLIGLSAISLLAMPVVANLLGPALSTGLRQALRNIKATHHFSWLVQGPVPPVATIFLMVPVALVLIRLWRREVLQAAFFVVVGVALSVLGIVQYVSPAINHVASVRTIGRRLHAMEIAPNQLAVYHIPREQSLGLSFYMDRALPEFNPQHRPASVDFVVANDREKVPEGHLISFFPGQHLRLWALPPSEIEIQIEPPPAKQSPPAGAGQ